MPISKIFRSLIITSGFLDSMRKFQEVVTPEGRFKPLFIQVFYLQKRFWLQPLLLFIYVRKSNCSEGGIFLQERNRCTFTEIARLLGFFSSSSDHFF